MRGTTSSSSSGRNLKSLRTVRSTRLARSSSLNTPGYVFCSLPLTCLFARYHDDAGNTWTGDGKRPGLFIAALAAGKTVEDLLIAPT